MMYNMHKRTHYKRHSQSHTNKHTLIHICTHIRTHTHTHTHTHKKKQKKKHTHRHTHTQTWKLSTVPISIPLSACNFCLRSLSCALYGVIIPMLSSGTTCLIVWHSSYTILHSAWLDRELQDTKDAVYRQEGSHNMQSMAI